ncbi:MAG: hypothetical protein M1365_01885 [Actinobacteria bacterium]|nr:hypothetical protein [Actinomycetota bacterium]
MSLQIIYFVLISIMAIGSIGLFIRGSLGTLPAWKARFGSRGSAKKSLAGGETLSFCGVNISILNYQVIRFSVLGIWLVLAVLLKITRGLPSFGLQLFLLAALFVATIPKSKMGRIKLPFLYISSFFGKVKREAANREIYRTISQLINLFTIKGETILGSNYILGEIVKFSKVTKPVYLQMLSMWNMNMREKAAEYFADAIGTKEAADLATIFLKLDFISPKELKGQLTNYQNNIKTEAITARERVNERNGNLIYILAIVSAVVVLLNFLVIVLTDVFSSYNLLSFK